MEILIGVLLALAVCAAATWVGFDRDRAFYPVILVVIASYYGLFAIMAGSNEALWVDVAIMVGFVAVAVTGFRVSLWIAAAGLLAHGLMDAVHHQIVDNPGVPGWWPMMCLGFDMAAAGYLGARLLRERKAA